ncbi:MAG: PorP/SprF family type IX secretion system membrane protein [Candidatus Cyclobacteriaceae bacterium M3_2C_046]
MKNYVPLLIILFFTCSFAAFGQQDAQFSQYMNNTIFYNPAFAGVEGVTKITAIHRSQWLGYNSSFDGPGGAPMTQVLSITSPILRFRSGVGFHLVNDQVGLLNNLEAQLSYAYHLAVREAKLSFGLRAGLFAQSINKNKFRPNDPNDQVLQNMEESQVRPDMAAGVYLRAEKYFAGVSFNHLLKSEFDFAVDDLRNALENHVYVIAGYDYEFNYDMIITPSILFKSDFNSYSFDVSLTGTYKDKLWGGLSFRQSEAAIAMIGYSILKDNSLRLGYSFDYVIRAQEAKQPTSHELMLSYTLPVVSGEGKKIIRTPRFRH